MSVGFYHCFFLLTLSCFCLSGLRTNYRKLRTRSSICGNSTPWSTPSSTTGRVSVAFRSPVQLLWQWRVNCTASLCFSPLQTRTVWEHGSIRQKFGHVGELWGQHGLVPGAVPAGRGGGQDGAAASGAGSQWLLHLRRAAGRLHPLAGSCEGRQTAARRKTIYCIKYGLGS